MKVSTRVEYGVQALADIALYSGTHTNLYNGTLIFTQILYAH